jgi:uncharacterized YkwD family protein
MQIKKGGLKMDEHERDNGSNFWKILSWILIGVIIIFGLGYCNPFGKTFNDFKLNKHNIERNHEGLIPGIHDKTNFPQYQSENSDLDKIKPFYTGYPSNRYHVEVHETLSELAYRLHMSIPELKSCNPNLANVKPNEPVDKGNVVSVPENVPQNEYEKEVVRLTNVERQKQGLKPLTASNSALSKSAMAKSNDMSSNNYFSHQSPTYGSPFEQMKTFGITYNYAAENIAQGQKTPSEVVTAWMNSSGHRANILNPNLTQIGVGYASKGSYWTQQFIGK